MQPIWHEAWLASWLWPHPRPAVPSHSSPPFVSQQCPNDLLHEARHAAAVTLLPPAVSRPHRTATAPSVASVRARASLLQAVSAVGSSLATPATARAPPCSFGAVPGAGAALAGFHCGNCKRMWRHTSLYLATQGTRRNESDQDGPSSHVLQGVLLRQRQGWHVTIVWC